MQSPAGIYLQIPINSGIRQVDQNSPPSIWNEQFDDMGRSLRSNIAPNHHFNPSMKLICLFKYWAEFVALRLMYIFPCFEQQILASSEKAPLRHSLTGHCLCALQNSYLSLLSSEIILGFPGATRGFNPSWSKPLLIVRAEAFFMFISGILAISLAMKRSCKCVFDRHQKTFLAYLGASCLLKLYLSLATFSLSYCFEPCYSRYFSVQDIRWLLDESYPSSLA